MCRRSSCGRSLLKAKSARHGWVILMFGAQAPVEFRAFEVWVAAGDCCRESAAGKSQTCSETLEQGRKSQPALAAVATAKPVVSTYLVLSCLKLDARQCIYLIILY